MDITTVVVIGIDCIIGSIDCMIGSIDCIIGSIDCIIGSINSMISNTNVSNCFFGVQLFRNSLEMPVPSQGHYGFHSFPVVD